jgi:predicted transposase/invertase (TIGR01784 family)
MSDDETNRMLYEARLKAQRDEYSRIQGALREGEQKKAWEVARSMMAEGVPVDKIIRYTGLSPEDIAKL